MDLCHAKTVMADNQILIAPNAMGMVIFMMATAKNKDNAIAVKVKVRSMHLTVLNVKMAACLATPVRLPEQTQLHSNNTAF